MVEDFEKLRERWLALKDKIALAAASSGRKPEDVTLLAVSKFHPASSISFLSSLGQADFGESYVREAMDKQAELAGGEGGKIRWHLIGHLQSKKAKDVVGSFSLIHSLDSLKLAEALQKRIKGDERQPVLIEVNVGREVQKSGVLEENLPELAEKTASLPGLELLGLMCIPPIFDNGPAARPFFARLRELREDMRARLGLPLPHLSMGMSGDFKEAIAEGASIVRVGTEIFGPRPLMK